VRSAPGCTRVTGGGAPSLPPVEGAKTASTATSRATQGARPATEAVRRAEAWEGVTREGSGTDRGWADAEARRRGAGERGAG
jgi:hypothetical protein